MKVNPAILKRYIQEEFANVYEDHGEEWILPSIEKPQKKKLYVNIEKGTGFDHIGGQGYSAYELLHEWLGFDSHTKTREWIKRYAFKANLYKGKDSLFQSYEKPQKKLPPPPVERIQLPEGCEPLTNKKHFIVRQASAYMHARGFTNADFDKYHLKVCVDPESEYYRRVIIPFIEDNEIVWYQGRAYGKSFLRYKNPKGVSKNMLVYNIDNLDRVAILMEGPLDAAYVGGQAIMGPAASDWQVSKILAKKPTELVVVPDSDEQKMPDGSKVSVGYKGALKTIERFVEQGFPINHIRVAFVEGGKDLNDLKRQDAIKTIYQATPLSLTTLVKFREKGAKSKLLNKLI